jgi:glycosyltransferase involved in cell wall biosynthesis
MKIVFVHEVSWFNKVVYEMHDFPELLSLRGHDVHFLDFDEGKPRAKWRSVTTVETRAHAGSRVSVTTPPRFLPSILGRLLATVIAPLVFLRLLRKVRPDVVVIYAIPTSGWQITMICRYRKIPVVARVIDIPHVLRETRFKQLVKCSEKYVFKRVDHISTHNEALRQYCIELGASPERSSVIYPGVDLARFFPAPPRADLQQNLGIAPTDKVLLFMGTLFRFSGLTELLTELAPALQQDERLKLLILGAGEDFGRLRRRALSLQLGEQVIMPGRIEYDELADHLRLGQVALLPFHPELVTHGALPGKVLQYLACGLPTVATKLDGLMSVIPGCHGIIYTQSTSHIASEAITLINEPTRQIATAIRGFELISTICDWEIQLPLFETTLLSVVGKRQ